ncbi:MAG: hypothetical protein JXO22_15475 [Phycisphaerae bacterium]|nr:hypothetical protein [Phycisphaerae bacterium]
MRLTNSMGQSVNTPDGTPPPATFLDRIPLNLRMLLYGTSFLALVLIVVPWAAYRVDVHLPAWHVEIGWARVIGGVLFAAALAVYFAASYVLTTHGKGAYVEFDPPKQFVATGPFRWTRNPIAGSLVMMLLGEAVAFSSTGIALLFVLSLPLAHLQVVLLEEPLLTRRFGADYTRYKGEVPRWFPRPPRRGPA